MKLLSIPEFAKTVNKSRQWIWKLVKDGRVKAQKIGGIYAIDESVKETFSSIQLKQKITK